MEDGKNDLLCPRCGSSKIVFDKETGETVCSNCGLVIGEIVKPPKNTFSEKEETASSPIKSSSKNMKRLMRIDKRLRTEKEDKYVLRLATIEIDRLTQELHLPNVISERAEQIYRRAQEEGLISRGTIHGFAAASVYAACRESGLPRSLKRISGASTESLKDISRNYRIILSELGLEVQLDKPSKLIPRLVSESGLTMKTERLSLRILGEVDELGYTTGKNPRGMAAAVVYLACKLNEEKCTQEDLADRAGVSGVTIRKRLRDLERIINLEKYSSS